VRGVEIGQSRRAALRGKAAGGAEGWRAVAESWDTLPVASNTAASDTPARN